jgi:hypothetical protein
MPAPPALDWMHAPARRWILAVIAACAFTAVLTYPTIRDFGTAGRLDSGDGRFSIWNVAWVAHAMTDEPRRLFDANIFFPHPKTLTYSEMNLVAGTLAAPTYALTRNPIAAHNAAVMTGLVVAFLATWELVRRLTGSSSVAMVSAAGYSFSAFTSSHTAEIQLLMIFGFPLTMLAFHRIVERPTIGRGSVLGVMLAITGLCCGYYGVFAAAMVGLAAVLWAARVPRYWIALGAAAAVAAILVLPLLSLYQRDRAAAGADSRATVQQVRGYSANWRDYLTSATLLQSTTLNGLARVAHRLAPDVTPPDMTEVLFPGWMVSSMAVAGLATVARLSAADRRHVIGYAAIAVAAVWASLGPDAGLYSLLGVLPGASLLRAPARFGIVAIFTLAVLAGFGLRRVSRGRPWVVMICLTFLVAELWVPWPLRAMTPLPRAYALLRQLPRGGVAELPFPYRRSDFHQHTRAMLRSTVNWQPLLNGYSDLTPADFYELAEPVNGFPDAQSFAILRTHQVRYAIVRLSDYGTGEVRDRLLARFPLYEKHLRLLSEDQGVRLYEITSWPEPRP